jgi:hypothetical protein
MINITVYDPRAIDSPHRGTGFRAYDANQLEYLIEKTDLLKKSRSEILWELDKLCRRAYMPGFSYMLDAYFSCGFKVLYVEGLDFIQHCAMWDKDLNSFDYILFKPGVLNSAECIKGVIGSSTSVVHSVGKEIVDQNVRISLLENIYVVTTKEDTLIIDFSEEPKTIPNQNKVEIVLHTKIVQQNYPEELPKDTPGITSI